MNETLQGIQQLATPILVIVLALVLLIVDLGTSTVARRRLLPLISIIGLIGAAVPSIALLAAGMPDVDRGTIAPGIFGGGMMVDRFGTLLSIILCIVAALSLLMSVRYLEEKGLNQGEFYALILFSTAGAMLMAFSYDLVNVFVGLEILSVALYILSGFARRELRSEESAVKYFLLGSFATGFLLYGSALVYGAVGLAAQSNNIDAPGSYTNFANIAHVLQVSQSTNAPLLSSPIFVAGIALIIVGLGFKASIVPFHYYAPDVYEGAPTGVTAFMSAAAKIGAFAALIRIYGLLPGDTASPFTGVLWGLAAATMIVGNVLAVRQTGIKRMLAYSSIAHAGYILVGVLASGTASGGVLSQSAVVYYLFAYTFMNLGAFAVVLWLGRDGQEFREISDYAGLARQQPLAAAVLSVLLLSLAGFPPASGFFGKLYLFLGAEQAGYVALATIGLLASTIGTYYYLRLIAVMYFRPAVQDFSRVRGGGARWAAIIAAVATLLLGVVRAGVFGPKPGDAPATGRVAQGSRSVPPMSAR